MLSLRAAVPEDARAIGELQVRSRRVAFRSLLPDEYLDHLRPETVSRHYFFEILLAGNEVRTVALHDGRVAGFASKGACREDFDLGELYAIYVDPGHWSKGLGRALISESRASLLGQGFGEAVLWVLEDNQRARRFYELDGWSVDGARRVERFGSVEAAEVRYRRRLAEVRHRRPLADAADDGRGSPGDGKPGRM